MITFKFVLECLYLMLPAYFANMTPVFVKGYKFLDIPLDANKHFRGKPILGRNKTWRGLIFAVIAAGFVALFQFFIYPAIPDFGLIYYSDFRIVLVIALLSGFGDIFGDAIESFFKRQLNIQPGKAWIPFDQIDFVVGAVALMLIVFNPGWEALIIILVISPILHLIINFIGYKLKIRKNAI
ncbi:MAG: CDP-archaeol synthase [Nanoarchaeota archaeon]|nr:CDP-archaeol synthase [Nanoarchaeota archaeon]